MSANVFQKGGYDYITAEIQRAIESGSRTAIITGHWEIDKAVRLPSNITLILENCVQAFRILKSVRNSL